MVHYPSSADVHVFPFGSGRYIYPYDHVLNESNISNIVKTVVDYDSYLISLTDDDTSSLFAKFVIDGYYFSSKIPDSLKNNMNKYPNVCVKANFISLDNGALALSGADVLNKNIEDIESVSSSEDDPYDLTQNDVFKVAYSYPSGSSTKQAVYLKNPDENFSVVISSITGFKIMAVPENSETYVSVSSVIVGAKKPLRVYIENDTTFFVSPQSKQANSVFTGLEFFSSEQLSEGMTHALKLTDENGNANSASLLKLDYNSINCGANKSLASELGSYSSAFTHDKGSLKGTLEEEARVRKEADNDLSDRIGTPANEDGVYAAIAELANRLTWKPLQ